MGRGFGMSQSLLFAIMLIFLLGIGSQWVAWRYRIPAIVVMSITGLIAGPFLGIMNPEEDFGNLYEPLISVAVAIILFEGSLSLKFKELRGLGKPIFRIATIGAFIAWILGSLTAHYMAGLSWAVSFVIGGLFIVTGPTVIMPLLRQSKLRPRPAKILKWEGIVVDPIGVLLAVFAFQVIQYITSPDIHGTTIAAFISVSFIAATLGFVLGRLIGWMFENGYVPEFLKSPVVFTVVIFCFTIVDVYVKGTGLLSVTAMGMTLANMGISSVVDMRHFKENVSMLLISAIFIMLSASLKTETLLEIFNPNIIGYVILMMIVVRPLSIFVSTINSGLTLAEKTLVGWIAPRGIVALTVSSYFASILLEAGYKDAEILTTLTFALVFATVVAHGFSLGPIAKRLNLSLEGRPGTLIVGSNPFTVELAQSLMKANLPVKIVDSSWKRLREARLAGVPFHHGEMLAEQTDYNLNTIPFDYMLAATKHYSYNSLICTTFIPEYGRTNVFKVSPYEQLELDTREIRDQVGGRTLFDQEVSLEDLNEKVKKGYVFRQTVITEEFPYEQYLANKELEAVFLYLIKPSGVLKYFSEEMRTVPGTGDTIVSLTPPVKEERKIQAKIENNRQRNGKNQL